MPGRRRRAARWVSADVLLALLLVVGFAPALGIERLPLLAAVLPARNAWTLGAAAVGVVLLAVGIPRRRRAVLPAAVAVLVGAAASGVVVLQHGVVNGTASAAAGLRILSWNINGDLVAPEVVADLARRERADVVVLPEIAPQTNGRQWAPAFARIGMRPVPAIVDDPAETVVFVRGGYAASAERSAEPQRSAVLDPERAGLPRIVAIHAIIPALGGTAAWDADLRWVAARCADPDTIAVGDFNTSVDGFGGPRLGGCTDVASAVHAASVGSWPTALPTWLAMPIDHVLTGRDWRAIGFTVLTVEDGSGSRHRPVLAVVARR